MSPVVAPWLLCAAACPAAAEQAATPVTQSVCLSWQSHGVSVPRSYHSAVTSWYLLAHEHVLRLSDPLQAQLASHSVAHSDPLGSFVASLAVPSSRAAPLPELMISLAYPAGLLCDSLERSVHPPARAPVALHVCVSAAHLPRPPPPRLDASQAVAEDPLQLLLLLPHGPPADPSRPPSPPRQAAQPPERPAANKSSHAVLPAAAEIAPSDVGYRWASLAPVVSVRPLVLHEDPGSCCLDAGWLRASRATRSSAWHPAHHASHHVLPLLHVAISLAGESGAHDQHTPVDLCSRMPLRLVARALQRYAAVLEGHPTPTFWPPTT